MDKITIHTEIKAPIEKVWDLYTNTSDIMKWNHASDDWHTPRAENDLREGGKFLFRMESKTESVGFDFGGIYNQVKKNEIIDYTMADGREVKITFKSEGNNNTIVTITFDPENENSAEMQRNGWQSILNNFKKYVENY